MNNFIFETIEHSKKLPLKAFTTSIDYSTFHWHFEYEIILVLRGSITVTKATRSIVCNQGDLMLINSKTFHEIRNCSSDNLCALIQIEPSFFRDFKDPSLRYSFILEGSRCEDSENEEAYSKIRENIASIILSSNMKTNASQFKILSNLYAMISTFHESIPHDICSDNNSLENNAVESRLANMLNNLNENYQDENVLMKLYEKCGMSEKTIYRFFKENLGESPYETLNKIRVEKAKRMLNTSKLSIVVIAERCGFGTENTFYRNFKKIIGVTPNSYRNNGMTVRHNPSIQGYLSFSKSNATALLKSYIKQNRRNK